MVGVSDETGDLGSGQVVYGIKVLAGGLSRGGRTSKPFYSLFIL